MRILILALSLIGFAEISYAPSKYEKAYNDINAILVQVPMKAAQHARYEKSLAILKDLAKAAGDKERAAEEAEAKSKIISEYLAEKKDKKKAKKKGKK